MSIARVGDINIEHYVEGEGPPLLLIHGFAMPASAWGEPFLTELRPRFQVIRFSNRGAGLSDKPDSEYTIPMMADDAVGLLDELNISKAHVLGCTGCGPAHSVPADPQVMVKLAMTPGLSAIEWARRGSTIFVTPEFAESESDALEAWAQEYEKTPTPPHAMGRQAGAGVQFDSYDRLPQMRVQTLILHGDKDRLNPVQNAHILHDRIPNSKLEILSDAGHMFFWEKPQESAKAIVAFLSSVPTPA